MKKCLSLLLVFAFTASFHSAFTGDMNEVKTCSNDPKECKKMIHEKMTQHGVVGVEGDWLEESKGLKIREFYPESKGMDAGLKAGDILTKINGISMDDKEGIKKDSENRNPGSSVSVTVLREGKEITVKVELISTPKKAIRKAILEHWEKFHPEFYKEYKIKKKKAKKTKKAKKATE